jgi:hypothetical protein
MPGPRFKWNPRGFEAIRRSPAAVRILENQVQEWVQAAGEGYEGGVVQGRGTTTYGRAIGTVVTYTNKAKNSNAKNHTLIRILGGQR